MSPEMQDALYEYFMAAEELYRSLGMACHNASGEMTAFVTSRTVEALAKYHSAWKDIKAHFEKNVRIKE